MDDGVRERLDKYMKDEGQSQSAVSRSLGISATALNQWLKGGYPGDVARIDDAVESFLKRQRERKARSYPKLPFIMTQAAKKATAVIDLCHTENEIGVIYGQSGTGKTEAVKSYAKANPGVILIEADPGCTARSLFSDLSKRLGLEGRGSIHGMLEEAVEKLNGSGRLIIMDEAESLPLRALELLRRLHDKAGVGVLLVGMPRLLANLRGERGELLQLYSRVGVAAKLEPLTEDDTKQILSAIFPNINGLSKAFHAESRANTRTLVKLISRARKLAELNGCPIDKELVKTAAETLII